MADCHNATALPAPSRRNFIAHLSVGAAGVALTSGTALASASAGGDQDAHLLDLLRRWRALDTRDAELDDQRDKVGLAAYEAVPVPPEIEHGAPEPSTGRRSIYLRDEIQQRLDLREMLSADARAKDEPIVAAIRDGRAAQERRKLAILDEYETRLAAERERRGYPDIETELARVRADMKLIEAEIGSTPAASLTGIAIKLFLLDQLGFYSFDLELGADSECRLIVGALRDAERLSGANFLGLTAAQPATV